MDSQEHDLVGIRNDGGGGSGVCDESKCVSKGRSNLHNDSFTCYGGNDGTFFPMMCADGFLPVIVDDEPPSVHSRRLYGDSPVSYFTCCPPSHHSTSSKATTETTHVTSTTRRQCSDPIMTTATIDFQAGEFDDDGEFVVEAAVCNNRTTRKYPRQMKSSWAVQWVGSFGIKLSKTDSFICCDDTNSNEDNANTTVIAAANFFDDLDCVPYRNEFYEHRETQNLVGLLRAITCDFPEGQESSFSFPRPMDEGTTYEDFLVSNGHYQCCKTGPALPPFIQDSAFKITVYLPLALFCVSAAVSALVVIALLAPLLLQLKNGSYYQKKRSSSLRARKNNVQRYSTVNLYLVYLSFFDLVYSLFQIGWYGSYANQKLNPRFHNVVASTSVIDFTIAIIRDQDGPITYAYTFINMGINAIISYELLGLLRKSQHLQKMIQPSLTRVNLQVGAVFSIAAVYGSILSVLRKASLKAGPEGNFEKVETISTTVHALFLLMIIVPICCISVTFFLIWRGGHIPSLKSESSIRNRAMRRLLFFFLRIVAVFYAIWIPVTFMVIHGITEYRPLYFLISWCLLAIQPILSVCMVFTKLDVRKYILALVTLSYPFGTKTDSDDKSTLNVVASGYGGASSANDDEEDDDDIDEPLVRSVLGFVTPDIDGSNQISTVESSSDKKTNEEPIQ